MNKSAKQDNESKTTIETTEKNMTTSTSFSTTQTETNQIKESIIAPNEKSINTVASDGNTVSYQITIEKLPD